MATQQTDKESTKTTERTPGRETYGGSNRETSGNREQGAAGSTGGMIGSSGSTYGSTPATEREHGMSAGQGQGRAEYGSRREREHGQGSEGFSSEYERSGPYGGGRGEGYRGGRMSRGRYGSTMAEEWTQKAEEAIHPIEDYVREKPMSSLMIAAGIGALLGLLFFRR